VLYKSLMLFLITLNYSIAMSPQCQSKLTNIVGAMAQDLKKFSQVSLKSFTGKCPTDDCTNIIKFIRRADPDFTPDPFNKMADIRKYMSSQIRNSKVSLHGKKHLKSNIDSVSDFSKMSSKDKSAGQYFNFLKDKIGNGSQIEKELLSNTNIGSYTLKEGVMYKYINFDEFKKAYPKFSNGKDGFGWGADCKGLAKWIRIELSNSATPVVHSHPRCRP